MCLWISYNQFSVEDEEFEHGISWAFFFIEHRNILQNQNVNVRNQMSPNSLVNSRFSFV